MSKGNTISINCNFCDIALFVYLCVLFAHQQESTVDMILRYGSLFLLVVSYFLFYTTRPTQKGTFYWSFSGFEIWCILLLTMGLASLQWCLSTDAVTSTLFKLAKLFFACCIVRPRLTDQEEIQQVWHIIFCALVYTFALLIVRTPFSEWGMERIGLEIGQHSNEVGRLACLGVLLAVYLWTTEREHPLLIGGCGLIFALCAFMTGSKNALLILIFQVGVYYFLISHRWKRVVIVIASVIGGMLILYLVMHNPILYQLVGRRIAAMVGMLSGSYTIYDGSTYERMYFIRTGAKLFLQHPIHGIGLNSFASYLSSIGYTNTVSSHCGFIELLSTLGIIGFVLYYSLYVCVLGRLFRPALRHDPLAAVAFTLILRFFLFDMTTISLYVYNSFFLLMVALETTHCLRTQEMRKREEHRKQLCLRAQQWGERT